MMIMLMAAAKDNLTDGFNREKLNDITQAIKKVSGVEKVKDIRVRVHGNNILVDVIVGISSDLTVAEGHTITEDMEKDLRKEFNITEVIVHVEPLIS
ncbi:hypothetical protein NBE98_01555 [Clostridium swellfunianum]|uniref:cation transporter dimerization domain-containing protein n=1 Tax=Clostridium swellfunianum TaxID=1367462 RepID=UPI00202EB9D3|nr:cation transporter dimerization domain-containing protein [Clostridium swellfunianum]MCM0647055.1 hypothetical protein [Clostridium swellfunianum]